MLSLLIALLKDYIMMREHMLATDVLTEEFVTVALIEVPVICDPRLCCLSVMVSGCNGTRWGAKGVARDVANGVSIGVVWWSVRWSVWFSVWCAVTVLVKVWLFGSICIGLKPAAAAKAIWSLIRSTPPDIEFVWPMFVWPIAVEWPDGPHSQLVVSVILGRNTEKSIPAILPAWPCRLCCTREGLRPRPLWSLW